MKRLNLSSVGLTFFHIPARFLFLLHASCLSRILRCFMRFVIALATLLAFGTLTASADSSGGEYIVLTGGPALRFMEHGKAASHDMYWFNFIDASVIRLKQLKAVAPPNVVITWLVYRPAYAARSTELGMNLLPQIEEKARQAGATLVWFDSTPQLISYFNKGHDRDKMKIASFDYFGHSNKACFLFDYSNTIDTMSIAYLHVKDLRHIDSDAFSRNALCKSWGCHSGEMYSKWWKGQFDVAMIGAIGKTDFSHGGLPVLSNSDGKWSQ